MRCSILVLLALAGCKTSDHSDRAQPAPTTQPARAPAPPQPAPAPAPATPTPPQPESSAQPAPAAKPVDASGDPVLAKMIGFRDRICACKEQACVDAVNVDMTAFANEQVLDPIVTPATATEKHIKRMTEVSKQTTDCIVKLMSK